MSGPADFFRPFAHRGLHDAKRGIIENTGPAFEAAIAGGYGIECDIRPIKRGVPIVFHDETLQRLVAARGAIADLKESDLKTLRYRDGETPILTLAALLDLVAGQVPLLIEIKSEWQPPEKNFIASVASQVSKYPGPVALMSFDPAVMAAIRTAAPEILRGIISGSYAGAGWWPRKIGKARSDALRDLLESGPAAPDFYAYEVDALPTPVTEFVRRTSGLPVFTWTVRTAKQRRIAETWADAMIFEGFRP
ncbi:glycerophosphodiester phosphodiesterase family protein [Hyphomicrobium sp.]|jgi:glycerophosphoryl diester phosphodiesterase|uniref:glycerophosphodiester phosphodiesterase family protein n=1 Tax=Hyphomicrobium sp. TaxID=82 RepID=UPI00356215F6